MTVTILLTVIMCVAVSDDLVRDVLSAVEKTDELFSG